MVWPWESSSDDKSQDPMRDLDPSLREFLKKESPIKYSSSNPPSTEHATLPSQKQSELASNTRTSSAQDFEQKGARKVPPESLFQDGRYAHIWKHYRPQAEIENENKSDQEKILDIVDGYKHRKAETGRAALESCALEQWDVSECMRNGGLKDRMTMCRAENRRFDRCYTMQSKFLKALGYLSILDRPPEVDEQIQMHADTLYHRMLDQEAAIAAAKAEGRPTPTFQPILSKLPPIVAPKARVPSTMLLEGETVDISKLPLHTQAALKKRLDSLNGVDRELEERAIRAELLAGSQVATNLFSIWEKQDIERQERKEQGKMTIGDRVTELLRFRPTFAKPTEDKQDKLKDGRPAEKKE